MSSPQISERRRWAGLAVLLTAAFMALLDVFIVFVATPSIAADLGSSPAEIEWVMAGYSLAFALALISCGRLGDLVGRRRMFRVGLTVFALGSLLCGLAPSAVLLIAARLVQGLGAAAMMPQVLSIIQVEFEPHERGRALAIMGGVQGAACVGGQLAGGALIELDVLGLGWRSVFLINLPVAALGLALSGRYITESRSAVARRLDLGGVALGLVAVGALVFPLVEGRSAGWPWWTWVSIAATVPAVLALLRWERRVERRGGSPLVVVDLFRMRPFRLGVTIALVVYTAMPGLFLAVSIYLQEGLHLSALHAGIAFVPLAAAFGATSIAVSRMSIRTREQMLVPAAAFASVGVVALGLTVGLAADPSPLALAPVLAVIGAGQGVVIPGLNGIVLAETPAEVAGSASGLLATAQQVGAALGVAITGTLFFAASELGEGLAAATAYVAVAMTIVVALCVRLVGGFVGEPAPTLRST